MDLEQVELWSLIVMLHSSPSARVVWSLEPRVTPSQATLSLIRHPLVVSCGSRNTALQKRDHFTSSYSMGDGCTSGFSRIDGSSPKEEYFLINLTVIR